MTPLLYLEECPSTNDEILKFISKPEVSCLAAYTFCQTKGRGQYGNLWEAHSGKNLAFSFALKTDSSTSRSLFNFHTATVIRSFLAKLTANEVKIKWPNDLIIGRKKVAGILIEQEKIAFGDYFIIGIGINVLQEQFGELKKAGSLFTQTGKTFDLHEIAEELFGCLSEKLFLKPTEDEIMGDFNQNLFQKEVVSVFQIEKTRQNGIIKYADKDGFLWIDLEHDGLKKFFHKEIEMLY